MGTLLVTAFLTVPILELLLFIYVEGRIGLGRMLIAVIITAIFGAFLVRQQGVAVLLRLREDLRTGVMPGHQLVHGALVLVGGALLLTPGFLTDAVGFGLMIPVVREGIRRWGSRSFRRRTIIIE